MLLLPVSHLSLHVSLQMDVAPRSWLRVGQLGRQLMQWHQHALSKVWLFRNLSHIKKWARRGIWRHGPDCEQMGANNNCRSGQVYSQSEHCAGVPYPTLP